MASIVRSKSLDDISDVNSTQPTREKSPNIPKLVTDCIAVLERKGKDTV